jgi:hypothetical protein
MGRYGFHPIFAVGLERLQLRQQQLLGTILGDVMAAIINAMGWFWMSLASSDLRTGL